MHNNSNNSLIKIEKLTYRYADGTLALEDIDMVVQKGETVSVIGQNGAGKTTLLLAISGALGNIPQVNLYFNEVDNDNKSKFSKIGLLFQNPDDQLFSLIVEDEIAFALHNLKIAKEQVRQKVLKIMSDLKLDIPLDREVMKLSFGQKRKVALASILIYNPELLLLDEPTYGIDPKSLDELVELLNRLRSEGKTTIIATHDISFAKEVSSKVAVLSESHRLIAYADPNTIFSNLDLLYTNNLIRRKDYQSCI